jgi:hypothetical protein
VALITILKTAQLPKRRLGKTQELPVLLFPVNCETAVFLGALSVTVQPRPQGLPRGGVRAEEDPGKIRWNLQDCWRFIACAVTTTLCCWLQLALALTISLLKNIHVLLIVYVFILKVLTNFTKNSSDISCEHTCTQNYATFIIILYQFVGVWRSYLW